MNLNVYTELKVIFGFFFRRSFALKVAMEKEKSKSLVNKMPKTQEYREYFQLRLNVTPCVPVFLFFELEIVFAGATISDILVISHQFVCQWRVITSNNM